MINGFSKFDQSEVTYKYKGSYSPITRTDFILLQDKERFFKQGGYLDT